MNKRNSKKRRNFKDNFSRLKWWAKYCAERDLSKEFYLSRAKRIMNNKGIDCLSKKPSKRI